MNKNVTFTKKTPNLPEEVILNEIISRLPVKQILCLRVVARFWRTIIDSPEFEKKQLEYSSDQRHFLVLAESADTHARRLLTLQCNRNEHNSFPLLVCGGLASPQLVGSSDGILCFYVNYRGFVLFNPAVRRYRNVQLPCQDMLKGCDFYRGFDGDYQIIAVLAARNESSVYFSVFSTNGGQWVRIDALNDVVCVSSFHELKYINNVLYVTVCGTNDERPIVEMVRYHLGSNAVKRQIVGWLGSYTYVRLMKMGLTLTVVCYSSISREHDVWVLKDPNNWIWDNLCTIPSREVSSIFACSAFGKYLAHVPKPGGPEFRIYDWQTMPVYRSYVVGDAYDYMLGATDYIEAMTSPTLQRLQLIQAAEDDEHEGNVNDDGDESDDDEDDEEEEEEDDDE